MSSDLKRWGIIAPFSVGAVLGAMALAGLSLLLVHAQRSDLQEKPISDLIAAEERREVAKATLDPERHEIVWEAADGRIFQSTYDPAMIRFSAVDVGRMHLGVETPSGLLSSFADPAVLTADVTIVLAAVATVTLGANLVVTRATRDAAVAAERSANAAVQQVEAADASLEISTNSRVDNSMSFVEGKISYHSGLVPATVLAVWVRTLEKTFRDSNPKPLGPSDGPITFRATEARPGEQSPFPRFPREVEDAQVWLGVAWTGLAGKKHDLVIRLDNHGGRIEAWPT